MKKLPHRALHAWTAGTNGRRDGVPRVASVLVEHGAHVPAGELEALKKRRAAQG